VDLSALPPEIQEKVYRPSEGESYDIDLDLKNENGREVFGEDEEISE
jgi:hypothetical protein